MTRWTVTDRDAAKRASRVRYVRYRLVDTRVNERNGKAAAPLLASAEEQIVPCGMGPTAATICFDPVSGGPNRYPLRAERPRTTGRGCSGGEASSAMVVRR